jgi:cytochrome c peroxidase
MKLMVCQTCHKASALCGQPLHVFAFCPPAPVARAATAGARRNNKPRDETSDRPGSCRTNAARSAGREAR